MYNIITLKEHIGLGLATKLCKYIFFILAGYFQVQVLVIHTVYSLIGHTFRNIFLWFIKNILIEALM